MSANVETATTSMRHVPPSLEQVPKLARYQLREYLRSRRFIALLAIVGTIGAILTAVVGYYRGGIIANNLGFYGNSWGGGVGVVIVLAAVFFGGDAIAGEFQNRTGYFLMGLPVRRATVYAGKFIAAYLASLAVMLVFLAILVGNGLYYFGANALPWQLAVSLLLALIYLSAVLGATFLFSSLFKTSAYGFVLTAILFIFGFMILEDLIVGLVNIEPWMVISYASSTIGDAFNSVVDWGWTGKHFAASFASPGGWRAGIGEGVLIMLAYLIITALGGLGLFEREEFT